MYVFTECKVHLCRMKKPITISFFCYQIRLFSFIQPKEFLRSIIYAIFFPKSQCNAGPPMLIIIINNIL